VKLYADPLPRRSLQVVGDLGLVLWVVVCIWLGRVVHEAVMGLAAPGRRLESAGTSLAERLRDAGSTVGGIPYVGDDVERPFEGAGSSADQLAAAGRSQVEAVETLAFWLALAVVLVPVVIALAVHLPPRIRFVRRATAGQALVDSGADLDLFALRAMAHQPLHVLARVSPDPAGAWRDRDPDVVRRLAVLELRDVGLAPPSR
jgi:hypothetical protein